LCKVNEPPELGCNALFCRNCRPAFASRYSTGSDTVNQNSLSSAWKPAVSSIHRSRYESMLSEVVVPMASDRVSQPPAISAYTMTKALRFNAIQSCVSNAENYRKPIEHRILRIYQARLFFFIKRNRFPVERISDRTFGDNRVAGFDYLVSRSGSATSCSSLCSPAFLSVCESIANISDCRRGCQSI
jgi:hypothetical protein